MGYQTRTTDAGFSLSTPAFVTVGGGAYELQNFQLGADAAGDETEQIQVLDEGGQVTATYSWLNENVGQEPGWYDASWAKVTGSIPVGSGFLMHGDAAMSIQTAGEVSATDTNIEIPVGFKVVGNCSPVDIDIQSITLADTAAGDETEQIQVLDAAGQVIATYSWLNENVGQEPGWYDASWAKVVATIKAGEAFLMHVDAPTTLTIPPAIK